MALKVVHNKTVSKDRFIEMGADWLIKIMEEKAKKKKAKQKGRA